MVPCASEETQDGEAVRSGPLGPKKYHRFGRAAIGQVLISISALRISRLDSHFSGTGSYWEVVRVGFRFASGPAEPISV